MGDQDFVSVSYKGNSVEWNIVSSYIECRIQTKLFVRLEIRSLSSQNKLFCHFSKTIKINWDWLITMNSIYFLKNKGHFRKLKITSNNKNHILWKNLWKIDLIVFNKKTLKIWVKLKEPNLEKIFLRVLKNMVQF